MALRGVLFPVVIMRKGYILLHRQGITPEEWKTPERTLAWFDLLTMVDFQTGLVTINYTFYERRWRTARSTIHKWVRYWEGERMCERTGEHDSERNGERFFIVNYAKYQTCGEQEGEQTGEQEGERKGEPRYKVNSIKSVVLSNGKSLVAKATEEDTKHAESLFMMILTANPADRTKYEKNPAQKEPRVKKWAEDIEKLKRIDGATDHQIDFMIKWLFGSSLKNALFWQKNVRSGATLREKWPQLVMACKEDHQRSQVAAQKGSLTMPENL
jgi:hypothetical protein